MRFEKTIFGRGMKWLAGFGVIVCVAATTVAAPSHDQTILDRPPPAAKAPRDLVAEFRRGPMASVEKLVFAVRRSGEDPHWYANFGYTLDHSNWRTYLDGGRLCVLDVATGKVAVLLDDPRGNVRDPQVDYDGRSVVFAYRPGGTVHYHLYEMRLDGSGLRQITDGPFDDVEPTWLPDGDLMFVSTRCRRHSQLPHHANGRPLPLPPRRHGDARTVEQQRTRQHALAASQWANPVHAVGVR